MDQPNETAVSDVDVFDAPLKEQATDHYELLLLVLGSNSDEEAAQVFEQAKQYMTQAGGTITSEQAMGRKTLAYKIQLQRVGCYFVVEFDISRQALKQIHEKLRIRKDVARFLVVKKHKYTAEEQMELQRRNEKITALRNAKMNLLEAGKDKEKTKRRSRPPFRKPAVQGQPAAAPATAEQSTEAPVKQAAPAAPKTMEEIDQEIDKLLSDDLSV